MLKWKPKKGNNRENEKQNEIKEILKYNKNWELLTWI